ncbi:hypothetical protein [Streptomyces xantholiticus]|uniref:hypothetical protein n=1 Tax=Streptomyces xantholiticus TaxID=68285 RepID=UPI0016760A19|nr:hypothetical protein [Streptomyces xantholiticus]GGW46002.1 hypothetical protein GCM10010381_34070 [Streptomyces xantholiticus]
MLIGRDRRHRLVVTASLLLGLLGALLGCLGGTAPAATAADWDAAVVAAATGPVQSPGCGRSAAGNDSGAHPGTTPRGGSVYELLPAPHQTGGPALPAGHGRVFLDVSPLTEPPPAPPSPVDLSVLRV